MVVGVSQPAIVHPGSDIGDRRVLLDPDVRRLIRSPSSRRRSLRFHVRSHSNVSLHDRGQLPPP